MYLCCIHNFNKSLFWKGVHMFSFYQNIDLIWFLSELNTPHQLSLFFRARIPRRPYVGHDNLKVELWVFSNYKVPLKFIFMKIINEHRFKIWKKNQPNVLCFCYAVFIVFWKETKMVIKYIVKTRLLKRLQCTIVVNIYLSFMRFNINNLM